MKKQRKQIDKKKPSKKVGKLDKLVHRLVKKALRAEEKALNRRIVKISSIVVRQAVKSIGL